MKASFGSDLKRFALNIDNVSDHVYENIMNSIRRYLSESIAISAFGLLVEGKVSGDFGLHAVWYPGGDRWAEKIKKEDGSYGSQVALAYGLGKPLWIVSGTDNKDLNNTKKYRDLWSETDKSELSIPEFFQNHNHSIMTSIILPLFSDALKPFGVLNLESSDFLIPNEDIKKELNDISEAIARLYEFNRLNVRQNEGTENVLEDLTKKAKRPFVVKRNLFLASPSKADDRVVGIIKYIFKKYFPDVTVNHWREESKPGEITDQIWKSLSKCHIGICYLSEKSEDSAQYRDNSNVLFESGMMEAMKKTGTGIFRDWIPIRESNSTKMPFDLSTNRMVIVERNDDNSISNEESIRDRLTRMVYEIFKS